ncbi:restriction endonuclease subunit S [Oceaniradius stylonematis]|uniref:restriction endonuclease subunit S n=1 Tax=Oceaniradius stylonematis TaxID=2184161 RepID=UPI003204891B
MSVEVPKGWREVRIGQIAREVSTRNHGGTHIPVLSMTKHRGFVRSNEYFSKSVHSTNTGQYKIVNRGQFAYATIHLDEGSIDYLKNEDMGLISPMYTVFEINPEDIDPEIALRKFKRFALSGRFDPYSNGGVNRRKSILFRDLSAFKFALPPLAEQRAIAEVLGSVEAAIAKTEALIAALVNAKNEILEDRLQASSDRGWKTSRLRDVATIRTGISKSKERKLKNPLSVPYLRVANVQDGYLDLAEIKTLLIERDQLERYSLRKGDVLFNEGGDFDKLGRGCVWNGEISPCVHQNHVFAVRCKPALKPEFLALLAASRKGKAYFRLSSKQTTNLASINTSDLRSFPVLLPEVNEQIEIAAIAKTFDERIAAEKASLAFVNQSRTALAQELLSGRIRLPDSLISRHRGKTGQAA